MAEDRQTQEQSIKDRKKQLYEAEAPASVESSLPFKDFLRTTPAAPLSIGVKAALWILGVIVVLLLVGALMKGMGGPKRPIKAASNPTSLPVLKILV